MNKTSKVEFTFELIRILVAVGIAYAIALITLFLVSDDPVFIIQQFVLGPFSSARRIGSIINQAVPFIFTGLCFCFMYAVNKFNLSGEGIFMFAGCVISYVAIKMVPNLPLPVMLILLLAVGALTGIVITMIPAWMDSKFGANIVVSSLMLNSILVFFTIYIVNYILRDTSIGYIGSYPLPDGAKLPTMFGKFRVQTSLFLAIIAVALVTILFYKMVFGYKMRVVGSNPQFARACGINMTGTIIAAQLIGGALAGMGGATEIMSNYDRFTWTASTQHGFDGLMVAVLARKNPLLVPIAALLLAYIRIGADVVNARGDIPVEFITVIQGIVILMVAADEFMGGIKKKMIYKAAADELSHEDKAKLTEGSVIEEKKED